jgi:hypothetical protein
MPMQAPKPNGSRPCAPIGEGSARMLYGATQSTAGVPSHGSSCAVAVALGSSVVESTSAAGSVRFHPDCGVTSTPKTTDSVLGA